ncbi:hypothetical protein, partial [Glaciecola sp. MF2-115]|uniref:hypothetical protein n=1 Tax=Glaciecola sp. MF2-115 TaxID=3384827 RepID=UPI0039A09B3C
QPVTNYHNIENQKHTKLTIRVVYHHERVNIALELTAIYEFLHSLSLNRTVSDTSHASFLANTKTSS